VSELGFDQEIESSMSTAPAAIIDVSKLINDAVRQLNQVILGKDRQLRLALSCLLARGHLLIEDIPGVGKTTLAHALAKTLHLSYQRIQFTSDLLPADIIGVSIFDRDTSSFKFHQGPIFAHLILADEVNRATPKAQSALLEAMEEQQVTVDGNTISCTFLCYRHTKPHASGWHLSVARITARSLLDAH
jgi:MoxR-like ATPase